MVQLNSKYLISKLIQYLLDLQNLWILILKIDTSFHFVLTVASNASFLSLKDGWILVPTRSGIPVPVNLESAFSHPQLLFNVDNDVIFELYTLKNKHEPQILSMKNISTITASNFNKSLPTRKLQSVNKISYALQCWNHF